MFNLQTRLVHLSRHHFCLVLFGVNINEILLFITNNLNNTCEALASFLLIIEQIYNISLQDGKRCDNGYQ